MKTSERFTNAVTKLYNAFHKNRLDAFSCTACAVGNICNNNKEWIKDLSQKYFNSHRFCCNKQLSKEDFKGLRESFSVKESGYSLFELSKIEDIFIKAHEHKEHHGSSQIRKECQFQGLCAVVEYLCELEGIPNVMDYTILFETENNEPKHKIEEVLC